MMSEYVASLKVCSDKVIKSFFCNCSNVKGVILLVDCIS